MIAQLQGKVFAGIQIDVTVAYRIVTIMATIIAILACFNILRGNYENPISKQFLYFKFDALWNKLLALASLKGMVQGFLVRHLLYW